MGQGRSGAATFVTVLGWVLIVLTGLGVLATLFETIVFTIVLAMPYASAPLAGRLPSHLSFPLKTVLGLLVGLSVLVFASAVAFVSRRGWARRTFVTLFAVAIAVNAATLALLVAGGGRTALLDLGLGERVAPGVRLMAVPTGVAAVGLSLLFGWLIRRLTSVSVRAEFDDRRVF